MWSERSGPRLAGPRRSTGVSVEALVRREGAASAAPRRGAHRRPRPFPRRTRLLVATAVAGVAASGTSTVALMSDEGVPARTVTGQNQAEGHRLEMPSAGSSESADEAELPVVSPDEIAAVSGLAAAAPGRPRPTPGPKPTEQPRPTQSLEPTPSPRPTQEAEPTRASESMQDSEATRETDGPSSLRSKGAESRSGGDRDRGSDGRSGGARRRG